MDAISASIGIDAHRQWSKTCTSNPECQQEFGPRSICGIRRNQAEGVCVEVWFGTCHAWAPAAILEPEPKCPVWVNGVEFKVMDLKALMTVVYDAARLPTVFGGARCDEAAPAMDESGRFVNPMCRDLTPDVFHILTANILGRFGRTFVIDYDPTAEVWNQPVRGYQIREQRRLTLQQGARLFFDRDDYPFNPAAQALTYVRMRLWWIVESEEDGQLTTSKEAINRYTMVRDYEYVLEMDEGDGIIG
ncbi:hypothetical protein HK102_010095, partial [Quaeritorhiza haematococci]